MTPHPSHRTPSIWPHQGPGGYCPVPRLRAPWRCEWFPEEFPSTVRAWRPRMAFGQGMIQIQLAVEGGDQRALDHVPQLAHVSGPCVGLSRRAPRRVAGRRPSFRRAAARTTGDAHDVVAALAQGRKPKREDVQPVVEILAEAAFADLLADPGSSPRARARRLSGARAADRLELALLQHAQELALELEAAGRRSRRGRSSRRRRARTAPAAAAWRR